MLFDGRYCEECEKAEQEPTIEQLRAEIERATIEMDYETAQEALAVIDKYAEKEPIEKITLWGGEQFVSLETYQQVCKERDIAVEQLHELGYQLGEKIEPCDTCKHNAEEWDGEHCDSCCGNHSGYEPCEDAVSRQAVLEILKSHTLTNDYLAIEQLPSVQPKAKTGWWINLENRFELGDRVKCSECGQVFITGDDVSRKYCPNCGARMLNEN